MATNNRSWMSTSSIGSRDQDDESLDSFSKDHQSQNTSLNSLNSNNNSRSSGTSSRPRGTDRYNKYKQAPSKVKPWMRDKAVTGTSSRGRFGGSARTRSSSSTNTINSNNNVVAEATPSMESNSCANSVCSNSSFPEHQHQPIVPNTPPHSSRSLQPYDDPVDSMMMPPPEEEVRQEEHSYLPVNEEALEEDIPRTEKEDPSVAKDETATVDTEGGSTDGTPEPGNSEEKIVAEEDDNITDELEEEEAPLEVVIEKEEEPIFLVEDEHSRLLEAEEEKSDKEDTLLTPTAEVETESVPAEPIEQEEQQEEEVVNGVVEIDEETPEQDTVQEHEEETAEVVVEPNLPPPEEEQQEDFVVHQEDQYNSKETRDSDDDVFYDVLPSIQPSSYNPMAASKPTTEKSVSAFANLEKPTPLVTAQAALLKDAIVEASEEETSVEDDEEEESHANNLSSDSLQGIKALDTTREESFVEEDVNFSMMTEDFRRMWPSSVNLADIPEPIHPSDWEQRQTLAAGETQFWIHGQLQQQLQGHDFKAGAYSEFTAALSDCPPLTVGFLAQTDGVVNVPWYCFCPCSAQMEPWRSEKLAGTEEILDVKKCADQQFTPEELEQHCRSTMTTSGDPESRFLHGMVHKYLESLFAKSHSAFAVPIPVPSDVEAKVEQTMESASTPKGTAETKNVDDGEIERLKESNADLLQRLKHAEDIWDQLEAKKMEAVAGSAERDRQLRRIRDSFEELEASNKALAEQLKLAEETKEQISAKSITAATAAAEYENEINDLREKMRALESSNKELQENLKLEGEKHSLQEARSVARSASVAKELEELKELQERAIALEMDKLELQQNLKETESARKDLETKLSQTCEIVKDQATRLDSFDSDVKRLSETNAEQTLQLRLAEKKHHNSVVQAEAQEEMMSGLCEEMKQMQEAKEELQKKLEEAEETAKAKEAQQMAASNASIDATASVKKIQAEKALLEESNAALAKKLSIAEDREKAQASREQNVTMVHVGDQPVDLRRFHVQCQKYFNKLREAQIKSHCVRDKSPVKLVIDYNPNERNSIDIQKILDKGAAVESQDVTYLFRALDTFNKGHFHTHKLLLPWKIVTTTGAFVSRSEFFVQVWQQIGGMKIKVGEKKTEVPLFQESLGYIIPPSNAVLEGMLRVTPVELNRIFAAKIAPYYRAIGRLMVQCIGATADDNAEYNLKILSSVMPSILRHKLFRGVDPTDESYPLEQLLDHAFSLLGIKDMTRDKAFEYFSIEAKDYNDTHAAVNQIRKEVHEMWIKERSLALQALEEGLTLGGLADMSFCCGLVPLEAVNEIVFSR